jgi:hypothetical protein
VEDAYLAQYRMRRLTGTPYKTGTAPIWAPVKIAAKVSGNWQTRQVPVLQRTYLQLAEPILPGGSGIARLSQTLPSVLAAKTSRGLKKAPTDTFATIGADQPGMGMTNRIELAQGEERGASLTLINSTCLSGGKFNYLEPAYRYHLREWIRVDFPETIDISPSNVMFSAIASCGINT